MSMPTKFDPDPYGAYERDFNVQMLQTQVFGAVFAACQFRKSDVGMTNVEISRRTGNSRSQISKLLAAPQNWTLKTIAELATSLDVDFRFVLVDRTNSSRCFDAGGISYDISRSQTSLSVGAPSLDFMPIDQQQASQTVNILAPTSQFSTSNQSISLFGQNSTSGAQSSVKAYDENQK